MKLQRLPVIANGFYRYSARLLAKKFDGVALLASSVPSLDMLKQEPHAIIYTTHASWWDVIVSAYVALISGLEIFAPMDADQLDKYWVLKYVGLFGVSSEKPLPFLRALKQIFERTSRSALLITPQAHFASNHIPSPEFKRGILLAIERNPDVPVYAITMHYEFWNESRPVILIAISKLDAEQDATSEQALREHLDQQTREVLDISARRDSEEWHWLIRSKAQTLAIQDVTGKVRATLTGKSYSSGHTR